jgi:hypothetical protein
VFEPVSVIFLEDSSGLYPTRVDQSTGAAITVLSLSLKSIHADSTSKNKTEIYIFNDV